MNDATLIALSMLREQSNEAIADALFDVRFCFAYVASNDIVSVVKLGRKATSPVRVSYDSSKKRVACYVVHMRSQKHAMIVPLVAVYRKDKKHVDSADVVTLQYEHTKNHRRCKKVRYIDNAERYRDVAQTRAIPESELPAANLMPRLSAVTKAKLVLSQSLAITTSSVDALAPATYEDVFVHLVGRYPDADEVNQDLLD
jgi:hypothetical protein